MFARATTFEGRGERVDDFRHAQGQHMRSLRRLKGY